MEYFSELDLSGLNLESSFESKKRKTITPFANLKDEDKEYQDVGNVEQEASSFVLSNLDGIFSETEQ